MFAAGMMLLSACTSDVAEMTTADNGRTLHTATLHLDGGIERFDTLTRATTSDWDDSARIYIQYQTSSGLVDGSATYNQGTGEWTVNYYGTITRGQQAKCEVYYFENPASTDITSVKLNAQSAVYADTEASYLYEDGVVTLKATLKALTGRVRFRGSSEQQVSFFGLKWYTDYNITTNSFSQDSGQMILTVASDGYTPYVYATFADASTCKLIVDSGQDDYGFSKSFDTSVLATGKSGYIYIPIMESRNGWQLINVSKQDYTVTGNSKTVTFNMVRVKAGTFQMGSTSGENDEMPVHQVVLTKDYYIGETEVTQGLWYAVMGQSPTSNELQWHSSSGQGDNYPAYYISYEDCQKFLTKLNQMTGLQFRFPTEAEWEFAARGGTKSQGYTYAGSNAIDKVAWYKDNSGNKTHEVKGKVANELGLYDMNGNVYEWCLDWYDSYSSSSQTNPTGPFTGSYRVYRGGSCGSIATKCCVSSRSYYSPWTCGYGLGFRLAL